MSEMRNLFTTFSILLILLAGSESIHRRLDTFDLFNGHVNQP